MKEFISLIGAEAVANRPIKPLFQPSHFLNDESSQKSARDFPLSSFMLDSTSSSGISLPLSLFLGFNCLFRLPEKM